MDPFRPSSGPRPPPPPARVAGIGTVLAATLVSAVLASVATVALVRPSGEPQVAHATTAFVVPGAVASAAPAPGASAPGGPSPSPSALPRAASDPNSVVVAVAARVSPAVVTITSDIGAGQFDPFSQQVSGVGSGFVFASDGWILTNDHVIEGATTVTVAFKDGRELPARVVATDVDGDLAVLKVDATGLATVQIGTSKDLLVGQLLIAIGSPLGTFSDSVTTGILSATGRSITVSDPQRRRGRQMTNLLQTDAAINPGNSGGPLLDGQGLVIGINSAVASSSQGIGFAIPIEPARTIMDQARKSS